MSNLKITELGTQLLILQQSAYRPKLKVTVRTFEQLEGQPERLLSTNTEYREQPPTFEGDLFVFTRAQYNLMLENYALGNCPVTTKGLVRYCNAYGSGLNWWKQPARTAKMLAAEPISIPKELHGLMSHITGPV